nr:phage major capsid protein [uncultured Rhodopila sp.]
MAGIQDLRERRAVASASARKLLDDNPTKWTPENQAAFDAFEGEISALDTQISNWTKILDAEANERVDGHIRDHSAKVQRDLPATDPRRIYDTWLRGGDNAVTAEQWAVVRNTLSTTTPAQGGYAVPNLISSVLIDAMKAYGTMRNVAEVIPTSDGKPLSFPSSDGTAETGEWVAQNTAAAALDPSFGTVSLNVFKASSKVIAVPIELLEDATIDMEAFVRKRIAARLGRICNTGYMVGVGTTQPDGVVPKAPVGKTGQTGQTLTIIYDDLVDLVHSVDPAYRGPGSSFMTSDSLLKVLRKLKDGNGRPLWTPSYDGGIRIAAGNNSATAPGEGGFSGQTTPVVFDYLLGYPLWVNNDIAAPVASGISLLFGDYSYYKIRDALDIVMFRFTDSAYAKLGQVGFLAWMRTGGNLVDLNAVKSYQHSAT